MSAIVSTSAAPASADHSTQEPSTKKAKGSSDMTEFTTKAKTVIHSEPDTSVRSSRTSGGILAMLANRFSSPFPIALTAYITVDTENMVPYFKSMWDSLIEAIYPDQNYVSANFISADNFALVYRYLTKARVDHVYASASGCRTPTHIPMYYKIPKSLADLINGIGVVTIQAGAFTVIPQPEKEAEDATKHVISSVSHDTLSSFAFLVEAAYIRGFIRTSLISSVPEGTAWWLLTARSEGDPTTIAENADSSMVFGSFKEWTPADGILCAIVQNKFDGAINNVNGLLWGFDTVRGISGLRRSFNLDA